MRFMMIVTGSEPPATQRYNEDLQRAGVLLDVARLAKPCTRIRYDGQTRSVVDGPFAGSIAGYWLIQVKSREEAIEWAKRAPFQDGEVELRELHEPELEK